MVTKTGDGAGQFLLGEATRTGGQAAVEGVHDNLVGVGGQLVAARTGGGTLGAESLGGPRATSRVGGKGPCDGARAARPPRVEPPRKPAQARPDASLGGMPETGHSPQWERPALFNAALRGFLERVAARPLGRQLG